MSLSHMRVSTIIEKASRLMAILFASVLFITVVTHPGGLRGKRLLLIGFLAFALLASHLLQARAARMLANALDRLGQGELTMRLPVGGPRHIARIATAYNTMAGRLEGVLRSEKQLMAGLSHELRTPLARLRVQTELLRETATVPESRLDAMERDLAEVDQLVGEFLELARLDLSDSPLQREPCNLRALVDEAVARHPLPQHTVTVRGSGDELSLDRTKIIRVFTNLLQNAAKYAPAGSLVELTVTGTAVEICDEGPGVPPEALSKLFDPFYRGPRGRQPQTGGLGLGLMIARQLVELHGGKINARNRAEKGFVVRIDFKQHQSR